MDWIDMPDYLVLVLERPDPCKDLREFVNLYSSCLTEAQTRDIMRQVVQAARQCAARGVLHHDISPENLLISIYTLQVKRIDFGCGELLVDTPYRMFIGNFIRSWIESKAVQWRTVFLMFL